MATVGARRAGTLLFSGADCADSHRVRIVLAEKGINYDMVEVSPDHPPEDLLDLNPYGTVPTLVDRDLVLYDARVVMEYLDERFPHPPLMPVDPVSRAHVRLILFRIQQDWYGLLEDLESRSEKRAAKARGLLRERLLSSREVFAARPYFMSDEFSLVDASLAPILWRLGRYRVELPERAQSVRDYAERMFRRDSFQASLTAAERDMQ